jgi:hypothetical protein
MSQPTAPHVIGRHEYNGVLPGAQGGFFQGSSTAHLARAFMNALRELFRDTITVVSCDRQASLAVIHVDYIYREL